MFSYRFGSTWKDYESVIWKNPPWTFRTNDRTGEHNHARAISRRKNWLSTKKTCFSIDKMITGTQIAALDHNLNINREKVSITEILFDFTRTEFNNKQNTEKIQYFLQFN